MSPFKRRDGFDGEKLISLPQKLLKEVTGSMPALFQLYITHIGYFPRAFAHYRERRKGCEDNILIYCIGGKGNFIIDRKHFQVTANQFILVPATDIYMRYWADEEDPWTIYWVHFKGTDLGKFNNSLNISLMKGPQTIPFNQKGIDLWHHLYACLEMGYSTENLCNAAFCLHHFLATFLFIGKHIKQDESSDKEMVTEAILFMKERVDERLSVEEMAIRHQLSTSHFSSLFRKATGMPPIDYFIHLKMQKACQLLFSREDKVKEIALSLGYEDQYYFSRIFKKNMGMSPEQYRLSSKKIG